MRPWSGRLLLGGLTIAILGCPSPVERRQESFTAAEVAAASGNLQRAEQILRRAHGFDPRDPETALRLAALQELRGRYRPALELLESFSEDVTGADWLNLRARLLLHCARDTDAARLATALAERDALEARTTHTFLAVVVERALTPEAVGRVPTSWSLPLVEKLLEQGDPATALAWMELVSPREPGARAALASLMEHAVDSSDRDFVHRVDKLAGPPESALAILLRRKSLLLAGRSGEIAQLDSRFLVRYPNHPRRHAVVEAEARRHLARGNAEAALRLADDALSLDADDADALVLRGLALELAGREKEAQSAYRNALAVDPDNRLARESLRATEEGPGTLVMRIESQRP